jgi:hypothetical protein
MRWHTRRNQISSFGDTDESIYFGGGVISVDYWQPRCAHQFLLLVVMLDTPCSEVVRRVLATHSIRRFPLRFLSRASPCAITFQLESTTFFRNVMEHSATQHHNSHDLNPHYTAFRTSNLTCMKYIPLRFFPLLLFVAPHWVWCSVQLQVYFYEVNHTTLYRTAI